MHQNESLREELLAEITAIAPILAEQAPESEKLGCLSDAAWEPLRRSRLLGFLAPRELGGDEADPLTQVEVIEALARIDASVSWVVGNLAIVSAYVAAFLPVRSAQRIFAERVPPMAGTNAPRGRAEPVLSRRIERSASLNSNNRTRIRCSKSADKTVICRVGIN